MKINEAQTIVISGRTFFVEKRRNHFSRGWHYVVREFLPERREKYVGSLDSMSDVRKYAIVLSDSNPHS